MLHWSYLIGLVIALFCMGLIDRRYRLALWHDAHRTVVTIAVGVSVSLLFGTYLVLGYKYSFMVIATIRCHLPSCPSSLSKNYSSSPCCAIPR